MGFDFTKIVTPIGQFDQNACWAASLSWWTWAMAMGLDKRKFMSQMDLIKKFNNLCDENTGGMTKSGIRSICDSAEIRINLTYTGSADFKKFKNINMPMFIIFNYPVISGTHMNIIFNQKGNTVACMEPYYPYPGKDGRRSGRYIRRDLGFFCSGPQVGIGIAREYTAASLKD